MAHKMSRKTSDRQIKKLTEEQCFAEAVLYMRFFNGMSDEEVKKRLISSLAEQDKNAREMIASVFNVDASEVRLTPSQEYVDLDKIISRARKYVESLPPRKGR